MALEIGQLIDGKYRIQSLIGQGGMGAVYEGENVRIGRRVAIKVLHADLTGNLEVVQRFEREAQAAGRIGSDHILEIIDLGQLADGDHFMVMEFLDGEPLGERIRRLERLSPAALVPIAKQLLRGLGAAHKAGIVHRDLKPDNIFILRQKAGQPDYVKIIDFGISKFQSLGGDAMKMTRTGTVMGTPYYMSPEQASGSKEADNRSDLYSVGVILYEAITGRVPFEATTFNQLMFKIVLAEIPGPDTLVPEVDPAFASMVLKAMARDVDRRFQTAEDFIQALEAWEKTGLTVTVPPAHAPDLVPAGSEARAQQFASAAFGATPPRTAATGGSWATSQTDNPARKSSLPIIAGLGAAAVFVLGVAGAAGYLLLGSKTRTNSTADRPALTPSSVASIAPVPDPVVSATPAPSSASETPSAVLQPSVPIAPGTRNAPPKERVAAPGAGKVAPPSKGTEGKPPPGRPKSGGSPDFGY
jgi:serine/threonine protein kinase